MLAMARDFTQFTEKHQRLLIEVATQPSFGVVLTDGVAFVSVVATKDAGCETEGSLTRFGVDVANVSLAWRAHFICTGKFSKQSAKFTYFFHSALKDVRQPYAGAVNSFVRIARNRLRDGFFNAIISRQLGLLFQGRSFPLNGPDLAMQLSTPQISCSHPFRLRHYLLNPGCSVIDVLYGSLTKFLGAEFTFLLNPLKPAMRRCEFVQEGMQHSFDAEPVGTKFKPPKLFMSSLGCFIRFLHLTDRNERSADGENACDQRLKVKNYVSPAIAAGCALYVPRLAKDHWQDQARSYRYSDCPCDLLSIAFHCAPALRKARLRCRQCQLPSKCIEPFRRHSISEGVIA